jgi:hypothetical protein
MPGFPKPEFAPHTHVVSRAWGKPACASCGRGIGFVLEDKVATIVMTAAPLFWTSWRELRGCEVPRA